MMTEETFDVAVVGYGPTGLVAASTLGALGHRVVVIERHPTLYGLPRLTHIDGETARIVQATGDVDVALRDAQALDSFRYLSADGEILVELPWAGNSCGHPAHISMYQPDIEQTIDARIRRYPTVTHLLGWEAVALEAGPDDVVLRLEQAPRHLKTGGKPAEGGRVVRVKYLLGADGANSFVRRSLGIGQVDFGVDERWLNIDTTTRRRLPERFNHTMLFCDPARPHMFMPIGQKRQRFEFAALPHENKDDLEDVSRAWRWLHEAHGLGPDDLDIIRQVLYPIKARVADTWSSGRRVFLLGDAAHTMPPTMGQGACSGMRDAITLSWKLDLVLRGRAGNALLDTYETERRPHAEAIVEQSVMLGNIAYTMDPERAAARDEAFRNGVMPPPPPFPIVETGVVQTTQDGVTAPHAGTLAPQGRVTDSEGRTGRFDDVFGHGFTLITKVDPSQLLDRAQVAFLQAIGCTVHTLTPGQSRSFIDDGTYTRYLDDEIGADLVITRPDFVVFGSALATDAEALLAQLRDKLHYAPSTISSALAASV